MESKDGGLGRFAAMANGAAVGLFGWALRGSSKEGWAMPGPLPGEDFERWRARASLALMELSERAEAMGAWSPRSVARSAIGLAKGVAGGYAMGAALGWAMARRGRFDKARTDALFAEVSWEVDLWDRSREQARQLDRIRAARGDASLCVPSLFEPRLPGKWRGLSLAARTVQAAGAIALAMPLAPLGWGGLMASLPAMRQAGWRRLAGVLRAASLMMGDGDLAQGPACAERAFEGWLDAAGMMELADPGIGEKTMLALALRAEADGARPLGLVRSPAAGWARMGGSEDPGDFDWGPMRAEMDERLARESEAALALWSASQAADHERLLGNRLGEEGARALASAAARWWGAAKIEQAGENTGGDGPGGPLALPLAAALLSPTRAAPILWNRYHASGLRSEASLAGVARADMEEAWDALAKAASGVRSQSASEGWPVGFARRLGVAIVLEGIVLAWARHAAHGGAMLGDESEGEAEWDAENGLFGRALAGSARAAGESGLGLGALAEAWAEAFASRGIALPVRGLGPLAGGEMEAALAKGYAAWERAALGAFSVPGEGGAAHSPRRRL